MTLPVKIRVSFKSGYGTFNTANYLFGSWRNLDKASYYLSVSKSYSDGHRRNSGYDKENYSGSFSYKVNENSKLEFGAGFMDDLVL